MGPLPGAPGLCRRAVVAYYQPLCSEILENQNHRSEFRPVTAGVRGFAVYLVKKKSKFPRSVLFAARQHCGTA
jgi:hypothetical protein